MKTLSQLIPAERVLLGQEHLSLPITGIARNAKEVPPGGAFFAIRGHAADGHRFLAQAKAAGAVAAVVEHASDAVEGLPLIQVASSRRVYAEASAAWFDKPSHEVRVLAVTGTNGKTTTTFLIHQLLEALGKRCGLIGTVAYTSGQKTQASSLTTPDAWTLQSLLAEMRGVSVPYCALEASSIALDQNRLDGTEVEVAIFTNLTPDHLDYHGDMEQYFQAKKILFSRFQPRYCVLNADDPASDRVAAEAQGKILRFSTRGANSDFSVTESVLSPQGIVAQVRTPEGLRTLTLPLIGRHNLSNALAAWASTYALGFDVDTVLEQLKEVSAAPGRLERVPAGPEAPAIFVDYAHTEDALYQVLRSLRETLGDTGGRILTVFGCGGDRDAEKRPRMAKVVSEWSDIAILTSDNPRTEDPERILDDVEQGISLERAHYFRESDRRTAIRFALSLALPTDLVLIAGKGHETYQIIGTEKLPFDDRQVVQEFMHRDQ